MKKLVIALVLLVLISSISLALDYGKLFINNVEIPYTESLTQTYSQSEVPTEKPIAIYYINANGQRIAKREKYRDGREEIFYFHNDHLGSATIITNDKGEIVEEKKYSPFGIELQQGSKIGYNSKELDKDTDLNYYGARYYGSEFGRFITPDTYLGDLRNPQTLNRYTYALNNPMKYIDPSGNQQEAPWWYKNPGLLNINMVVGPVIDNLIIPVLKSVGEAYIAADEYYTNKVHGSYENRDLFEAQMLQMPVTPTPILGVIGVGSKASYFFSRFLRGQRKAHQLAKSRAQYDRLIKAYKIGDKSSTVDIRHILEEASELQKENIIKYMKRFSGKKVASGYTITEHAAARMGQRGPVMGNPIELIEELLKQKPKELEIGVHSFTKGDYGIIVNTERKTITTFIYRAKHNI